MSKIRSNVPLVYNSRNQASGIIMIEIADWTYRMKLGKYVAKVTDYLVEITTVDIDGAPQEIEKLTIINTKEVMYTTEQINALYSALENPIELTEQYSDEMDNLISNALLYVTQQDPVYGSVAANWELV